MLSKNKFKYIQSLRLKKNRWKLNKYIIEGEKMVKDYLDQFGHKNTEIFALDSWSYPSDRTENIHRIDRKELQSISSLKTPNKVLIIADIPPQTHQDYKNGWYIYLNDLQDPGNMGTLLRSAYWFGLQGVILSPNCVDIYNSKVVQASMSAIFHLNISTITLEELTSDKDIFILASAMQGLSIYNFAFPQNGIFVMGNEGKGLTSEMISKCDKTLSIPAGTSDHAESLNVGVAGSIIMSYIKRQY